MNLVAANAASFVPLPAKPRHQSEGLTPEQVGTFLEAAKGDRLYPSTSSRSTAGCVRVNCWG